jgi:acyl-CoA thioester hydrolase
MIKVMYRNQYSFRVRYGETDQMGFVYHGNYAQYIEMGRLEWLRDLGISYKEMEENGIMLPVYSLNIRFVKSAFYDDILTITTSIKKAPSVRIEFTYEIHNQQKELLTTAETTLVFINMKTGRPTKCPDYILKKLK